MRNEAKTRANVTPHLPPGETYVAACPAMGGPIDGFATRYRVIAVSDRSVHLYSAAWFSICKPKRHLATLPPGSVLSANRRFNYQIVHVGSERLWVKLAHWKDLRRVVEASEQTLAR